MSRLLPSRRLLALAACAAVGLSVVAPGTAGAAPEPVGPHAADVPTAQTSRHPPNRSHYCQGCVPPLTYDGGPVADTSAPTGLTITPIYWVPRTTRPFPIGYTGLINGYIRNIAAASGSPSNVYSITSQYSAKAGGKRIPLRYKYTAGTPIVDTAPFPRSGCPVDEGFTNCLTDAQLVKELSRLKTVYGLKADLQHFYPLFTAPTVETMDRDGSTSLDGYCGYHRHFGNAPRQFFYGNEVFEAEGCGEGQSPNNNIAADSAISTLSHEIAEHVTDPDDTASGWTDAEGMEIGDICGSDYGRPLGSTNPRDPQHTEYNQVIGNGKYYTQTEFSNAAYKALGAGYGCQQNTLPPRTAAMPGAEPSADSLFINASPNVLDAQATSTIEVYVLNSDDTPTHDDRVQFSQYVVSGTGECGTFSADEGSTDDDGFVSTTYTASADDVVCAVVAKDALAGKAATVAVYQGATREAAPAAADTFPESVLPGRATTFTTTFTNHGADSIVTPAIDLQLFPGEGAKTNVTAEQVSLAYSTKGATGPFQDVELSGSTLEDGAIAADMSDATFPAIAPGRSLAVTYRLTLAADAAPSRTENLFALEAYLEQMNPAAGTSTTLADTLATEVQVRAAGARSEPVAGSAADTAAPRDRSRSALPLAVAGAALLAAALAAVVVVRRRRRTVA